MSKISLLDCTLRDGGYCNGWNFGNKNIYKILKGLIEANIDIIECGYLSQIKNSNKDSTLFSSFERLNSYLPKNRESKMFVGMINFGEFNIDDIPQRSSNSIDGIRVAFHKHDRIKALDFCKKLKEKGYEIFIQGMVSLSYTDEEFLDLIKRANSFNPYAFYIVDSFGMMKRNDLLRLFYSVDHNLSSNIKIGFHSHNNMQLAYSNSLNLSLVQTNRNIIIDSSIYGMGRGAGNLNTELFSEYLNESHNSNYKLKPLLNIVDEILDGFYKKNYWGYSLPNYISAKNNAHPNYAAFLAEKNTLTVEDMENIFQLMDPDKKVSFDKKYVEDLYCRYQESGRVYDEHKQDLKKILFDKKIVLIAPGKSLIKEKEKIELACKNSVVISVNFNYYCTDFIFISNLRRFRELSSEFYSKCIATSNITSNKVYMLTKYSELTNTEELVSDNAGLMAIRFLMKYGVKEIALAGFDGYSHEIKDNYADNKMTFITKSAIYDAMNHGISKVLKRYSKKINIYFVTKQKYLTI